MKHLSLRSLLASQPRDVLWSCIWKQIVLLLKGVKFFCRICDRCSLDEVQKKLLNLWTRTTQPWRILLCEGIVLQSSCVVLLLNSVDWLSVRYGCSVTFDFFKFLERKLKVLGVKRLNNLSKQHLSYPWPCHQDIHSGTVVLVSGSCRSAAAMTCRQPRWLTCTSWHHAVLWDSRAAWPKRIKAQYGAECFRFQSLHSITFG